MAVRKSVSSHTRNNWLIDFGLFTSGLVAFISGIYFLFLPIGGYQGGRNPTYGVTLLFERHTWEGLHTWLGLAMIVIALVHIPVHWRWIVNMTKRVFKLVSGQGARFNAGSTFNLLINGAIGLSFALTALSGLYFFFIPDSGIMILFGRPVWDLIHTWAGTVMIAAAVLHFSIHWKWVTKVTRKICKRGVGLRPVPVRNLGGSK